MSNPFENVEVTIDGQPIVCASVSVTFADPLRFTIVTKPRKGPRLAKATPKPATGDVE
jgi:hypothetical protein